MDRSTTPRIRSSEPRAGAGRMRLPYALLASLSTVLAVIGVVLPGLPTTPFLLLAAWAARRGCPPLDRWLRAHRRLGPVLHCWETQRAVPPRAKAWAVGLLAASWMLLAATSEDAAVPLAAGLMFAAIAAFVLTRPTPRPVVVDE